MGGVLRPKESSSSWAKTGSAIRESTADEARIGTQRPLPAGVANRDTGAAFGLDNQSRLDYCNASELCFHRVYFLLLAKSRSVGRCFRRGALSQAGPNQAKSGTKAADGRKDELATSKKVAVRR